MTRRAFIGHSIKLLQLLEEAPDIGFMNLDSNLRLRFNIANALPDKAGAFDTL